MAKAHMGLWKVSFRVFLKEANNIVIRVGEKSIVIESGKLMAFLLFSGIHLTNGSPVNPGEQLHMGL